MHSRIEKTTHGTHERCVVPRVLESSSFPTIEDGNFGIRQVVHAKPDGHRSRPRLRREKFLAVDIELNVICAVSYWEAGWYPGPRSTFPGSALVARPASMTAMPFTRTKRMPCDS